MATPARQYTTATLWIATPRGQCLQIDVDTLDKHLRDPWRQPDKFTDPDTEVARRVAQATGLTCTIERTTKSTYDCVPED